MDGAGAADLGIPGYDEAVEIGRGGFGVVYRAREAALDRVVAVKLLAGGLDARGEMMFRRECRALGAVAHHPGIVSVYAAGVTGRGQPYLVMEYLPGGTLADRLEQRGPLPWQQVAALGVQLCDALEAAHLVGVLHRDVKPENVFLSRYDQPQLGDFGIARVAGGEVTRSAVVTASLAHAPPEALSPDEPLGPASDVYSLASTLHMLLTGRPPLVDGTEERLEQLLVRILTATPPDLRPRGVPDDLASVLEDALAKEPAQRPPSAAAFGRRLQDVQRGHGLQVTAGHHLDGPEREVVAGRLGTGATRSVPGPPPREPAVGRGATAGVGAGRRSRWTKLAAGVAAAVLVLAAMSAMAATALRRDAPPAGAGGAPTAASAAAASPPAASPSAAAQAVAEPTAAGSAEPTAGAAPACDVVAEDRVGVSGVETAVDSVQALVDALGPGLTGCLAGDRFDESLRLTTSGEPRAPVTLRAAPGFAPVLVGGIVVPASTEHVVVEGLRLEGGTSVPAIRVFGRSIEFRGNDVSGPGTCFYVGDPTQGTAVDVAIRGNRIHDCGDDPASRQEHGISAGIAQGLLIRDNTFFSIPNNAVLLYPNADNTVITHNTFAGNGVAVNVGGEGAERSAGSSITRNVIALSTEVNLRTSFPPGEAQELNNVVADNCLWDGAGGAGLGDGFTVRDNVTADPAFADPANYDFTVAPTSACAGRGAHGPPEPSEGASG